MGRYDLFAKITLIIVLYISHNFIHELGHYIWTKFRGVKSKISMGCGKLILKFYDLEIRANPILSYVECYEFPANKTFYASGIISSLILFLVNYTIFNEHKFVWIYSAMCVIENIVLVSPSSDIWNALSMDKYFTVKEKTKFMLNVICLIISLLVLIAYCVWFLR